MSVRFLKPVLYALPYLMVSVATAFAADNPPPANDFNWQSTLQVKSLAFGNALFEYYRGHSFDAITAIQVAELKGQLAGHELASKALLGSLELTYDMVAESERVLTESLKSALPDSVRLLVLSRLVEIRYRAGDDEGALKRWLALPPIPDPVLKQRMQMVGAQIALHRKDPATAAKILGTLDNALSSDRFVFFNLGVAQLQLQQGAAANFTFSKLLSMPATSTGDKALRDRTLLAQGYDALRNNDNVQALNTLQQVHLQGPYSTEAMLGLGWSYAKANNYKDALRPWFALTQRNDLDLSVQEGRLALPYAYQKLGAMAQSLAAYQQAIDSFDIATVALDTQTAVIDSGQFVPGLMEHLNLEGEYGAAQELVPDPALKGVGDAIYATHGFNSSFKRYQELHHLHKVLVDWQERLPIYAEMLSNHELRFQDHLPKIDSTLSDLDIAAWGSKIEHLRENVNTAQQPENWTLLANAAERKLLSRIERDEAHIKSISRVQPVAPLTIEKLRWVRGVLQFNIAREASVRSWDMRRELKQTEDGIRELNSHRARLLAARTAAANRFGNYVGRIDIVQERNNRLLERTDKALQAEEKQLNDMALAEIARWRKQLSEYRMQAQLALARLQDQGSQDHGNQDRGKQDHSNQGGSSL